jgi:SAM-dependent methyltransferase
MEKELTQEELKELAKQLSCPHGEVGIEIAKIMNKSNKEITENVLLELDAKLGESIIEIAPGNGVLSKPLLKVLGESGKYLAVDFSGEMLEQITDNLGGEVEGMPTRRFIYGDARSLKLDFSYDKIFAVNFLYFIKDLDELMQNLATWLNPAGKIVFGIRDKETLKKLPMTEFGFEFHSKSQIESALSLAGFKNIKINTLEEIPSVQRQVKVDYTLITHIISASLK